MPTIGRVIWIAAIAVLVANIRPLWADAPAIDAARLSQVYAMYADYRQDFPGVSEIDATAAGGPPTGERIQFVDVRKPAEIAVSTLPGAIDKQSFLRHRHEYTDKTVVAFCTIGYRSGLFAQEMADQGVRVKNLKGGILAWALEGGNLFDRHGETRRLHVYGPKWDLAPSGFETQTFGLLERLAP